MVSKEEIAIQDLKIMRDFWEEDSKEYMDIAIKSVEKQIPKRVRSEHGFKDVCFCSFCGRPVCQWQFGDLVNYCFYCGQKLRWTND